MLKFLGVTVNVCLFASFGSIALCTHSSADFKANLCVILLKLNLRHELGFLEWQLISERRN